MKPHRPRGLRSDEQELWDRVRKSTIPMHNSKVSDPGDLQKKPNRAITPKFDIPTFRVGQNTPIDPRANRLAKSEPLRMDSRNYGRIKKGKIAPEARIDLHGMTISQAHPVLIRFVQSSFLNRNRLILVITGKGRSKPDQGFTSNKQGILKYQVPEWLHQHPLAEMVQQVSDAHLKHGGSGALYVYLRRND